jgi:[ribosomal protein S5]-alanine N-acetyltransferase
MNGEVNSINGVNEEKEVEKGEEKLKMIGIIGIVREQEIGYKLHPEFWGRGFMSEALKAFIEFFFKNPSTYLSSPLLIYHRKQRVLILCLGNEKYDRLLAAADPENGGSMRVLEKAGFVKGEYKVGFYERGSLGGKKSDMQCFYLQRPQIR